MGYIAIVRFFVDFRKCGWYTINAALAGWLAEAAHFCALVQAEAVSDRLAWAPT
jgi:hypothetical protein